MHNSCTWGSEAALCKTVSPSAVTAAMMAFSVAVTLASSKRILLPTKRLALNRKTRSVRSYSAFAPRASKARICVSTLRRPITSPPGGGKIIPPARANIGPASRMDARILRQRSGSNSAGKISLASIRQECSLSDSNFSPKLSNSARMFKTS